MSHLIPVMLALCLCITRFALAAPAGSTTPMQLQADGLSGRTAAQLQASGDVLLEQDNLRLQADRVDVQLEQHQLQARGRVRLTRGADLFSGSELDLDTENLQGVFRQPKYQFSRTQGGGSASRIDFLGRDRYAILDGSYSTCRVEADDEQPAWVLQAREVRLDIEANEGIATGAVLRFYGVPLLAAPVLSFPVTDQRKSGWLPPDLSTSSTVGFEFGLPYYWNIAPELDATLTPTYSTKRGSGLGSELRYLQPGWGGELRSYVLPNDQAAGTQRWAARWRHGGSLDAETRYGWEGLRVSDNAYWKDGLRNAENLTPRLLPNRAELQRTRRYSLDADTELEQQFYARAQRWQTLQSSIAGEQILSPYRREPQIGASWQQLGRTLEWQLQTEVNRFSHEDASQLTGNRAHLLGSVARPYGDSGWQLTPRLSLNAAAYDLDQPLADGRTRASRVIPTFSLDSRWQLERPVEGAEGLIQTLEPRLMYLQTPWRDQTGLPNFDSAALDYNDTTVFAENTFSGVDRVADAHQLTGGLTSRFIDAGSGAELARLGLAQRYLLREQLVTPDGVPLTARFSDLLLLGSTRAITHWHLDAALQYNSETERIARSILSARYTPGAMRTVSATYRLQRDVSEQFTLGWQWPLYRPAAAPTPLGASGGGSERCSGTLYGVGRADYSMRDRRLSSSLAGLEYDSGCWIGRLVVERKSTGTSDSATKVMLQLELVGLSRLGFGSNPLSVLKDNIPGYQLLRDAPAASTSTSAGPASTPLP